MGITICIGSDVRHLRYSTFNQLRNELCVAAGYGTTSEHIGYGGSLQWTPDQFSNPLVQHLLLKSDDGDEIDASQVGALSKRLMEIIPQMTDHDFKDLAKQLAEELRICEKEKRGFYWR